MRRKLLAKLLIPKRKRRKERRAVSMKRTRQYTGGKEDIVSVQTFYKEFNASKREYFDYQAARAEWEKNYGGKVVNFRRVRNRLRQKEQIVKERETSRDYRRRQKDKSARCTINQYLMKSGSECTQRAEMMIIMDIKN